jgi:hypothetical protein
VRIALRLAEAIVDADRAAQDATAKPASNPDVVGVADLVVPDVTAPTQWGGYETGLFVDQVAAVATAEFDREALDLDAVAVQRQANRPALPRPALQHSVVGRYGTGVGAQRRPADQAGKGSRQQFEHLYLPSSFASSPFNPRSGIRTRFFPGFVSLLTGHLGGLSVDEDV